jgi:hypothetical protein
MAEKKYSIKSLDFSSIMTIKIRISVELWLSKYGLSQYHFASRVYTSDMVHWKNLWIGQLLKAEVS